MVHVDFCTINGIMKAYAFNTPSAAAHMLEGIKNDDFQWFNLEWNGESFDCPKKFLRKLTCRSCFSIFRK